MIDQAKFTYSPLDQEFEKPRKTIEDQGEKQIKELEEHGKQLAKSKGETLALWWVLNTFKTKIDFSRTC